MTPCSIVGGYKSCGDIFCLHLQGRICMEVACGMTRSIIDSAWYYEPENLNIIFQRHENRICDVTCFRFSCDVIHSDDVSHPHGRAQVVVRACRNS